MSIAPASGTAKGWQASRLLLWLFILLFLAAKLYFVCVGTTLTSMARLGDDAYVYLWKGKVLTQTDEEELRAVRELLEQARSQRPVTRDERWLSSR
jgi:hypothetical protein